ncbi:hypothetical protein [uncultured Litoreibacter sp.]|uniref:hypothetical protein n=1 Tax=uncultured Litoreibacter sp. TaxID=1392394 RepID=UPI00262EA8E4|nr:hypothetical protein [uncultured Litoreibacter sp.]
MRHNQKRFLETEILALSLAEQAGFSSAKAAAELLEKKHQFETAGVGRGMLLAAMNELERELSKMEVTKLVYAAVNGYAWRKTQQIIPYDQTPRAGRQDRRSHQNS